SRGQHAREQRGKHPAVHRSGARGIAGRPAAPGRRRQLSDNGEGDAEAAATLMKRHNQGKKPGDPALAPYPGLTIERGVYYVRHPITKRKASLGTKDFHEAVTHYLLHKKQWADQVQDLIADKIVSKMLALSNKTVT